jgi:hypothetical protein
LRFAAEEQLDDAILELNVVLERSPKSALFFAGEAFEQAAAARIEGRDAGSGVGRPIKGRSRISLIPGRVSSLLYRENFLYFSRCGMIESVPSRRILSAS